MVVWELGAGNRPQLPNWNPPDRAANDDCGLPYNGLACSSRPDDRRLHVGGKSELPRAVRWVTPSPGDGKESATENIPPSPRGEVRVKRCGKSAPLGW